MIKIYNIILYAICIFFIGILFINKNKSRENFLNLFQDKSYMNLINGLSVNDNTDDNLIQKTGVDFNSINVPNRIIIPDVFSNNNFIINKLNYNKMRNIRIAINELQRNAKIKGDKLIIPPIPRTLCFKLDPIPGGFGGCRGVLTGNSIFYTREKINDCFREQVFCRVQENDNDIEVPRPRRTRRPGGNTAEQEANAERQTQKSENEYANRGEGVPGMTSI